jgi:hypothetical protein
MRKRAWGWMQGEDHGAGTWSKTLPSSKILRPQKTPGRQGLKPIFFAALSGTAKAVPFHENPINRKSSIIIVHHESRIQKGL